MDPGLVWVSAVKEVGGPEKGIGVDVRSLTRRSIRMASKISAPRRGFIGSL
jgi:hypothetical protein